MKELLLFTGKFFKVSEPTPVKNLAELADLKRLVIWINSDFRPPICSIEAVGDFAGHFLFDIYKDPIMEVENCQINGKLISPGRLYYKVGWMKFQNYV